MNESEVLVNERKSFKNLLISNIDHQEQQYLDKINYNQQSLLSYQDSPDQVVISSNASNQPIHYHKQDWIKVTFNNETKRIHNPPESFDQFLNLLKTRFRTLEPELIRLQNIVKQNQESNEQAQDIVEITLSYLDSDDEDNYIEDSRDLVEAYKYSNISSSDQILKLTVEIMQRNPQREIELQRNQDEDSDESVEEYKPNYDEEPDEQENLKLSNEEAKEEIKLPTNPVPVVFNYNKGEEIKDSFNFDQNLYYSNLNAIPNFEDNQKPPSHNPFLDYSKSQQQKEQQVLPEPPKPILVQQNISPQKMRGPIEILIGVQCVPCKNPDYLKNKQKKVKQHKGVWNKIMSYMSTDQQSKNKEAMAKVVSLIDCYTTAVPPTDVRLQWIIQNQSDKRWEHGVMLKQMNKKEYFIQPVRLSKQLEPGELLEIRIDAFLPKDLYTDQVAFVFQLESQKGEKFGDSMVGIIDIKKASEVRQQKQLPQSLADLGQNDRSNSYQYFNQANPNSSPQQQEQSKPDAKGEEEESLYIKASILSDEGFGTFDACYQVLKACRGNEVEAQNVLSKLIFKEHRQKV